MLAGVVSFALRSWTQRGLSASSHPGAEARRSRSLGRASAWDGVRAPPFPFWEACLLQPRDWVQTPGEGTEVCPERGEAAPQRHWVRGGIFQGPTGAGEEGAFLVFKHFIWKQCQSYRKAARIRIVQRIPLTQIWGFLPHSLDHFTVCTDVCMCWSRRGVCVCAGVWVFSTPLGPSVHPSPTCAFTRHSRL